MDDTLKVCRNCQRFDWNDTLGLSFVEERQCQRNKKGKCGMLGKKDGKNVIYPTNVWPSIVWKVFKTVSLEK